MNECNNNLNVSASELDTPFNFQADGLAYVYHGDCSQFFYTHNYMVVDATWTFPNSNGNFDNFHIELFEGIQYRL